MREKNGRLNVRTTPDVRLSSSLATRKCSIISFCYRYSRVLPDVIFRTTYSITSVLVPQVSSRVLVYFLFFSMVLSNYPRVFPHFFSVGFSGYSRALGHSISVFVLGVLAIAQSFQLFSRSLQVFLRVLDRFGIQYLWVMTHKKMNWGAASPLFHDG